MTLLLLGGTNEAKQLAASLHKLNVKLIYSIAGLVRIPKLECEMVIGGFSRFGGLDSFIKENNISAILDVTHPYAQNMSHQAVVSSNNVKIPCWRFHRHPWQVESGDDWQMFESWQALLLAIKGKKSVFFSVGQLPVNTINVLNQYAKDGQKQLLRTAVDSTVSLPGDMKFIKGIGPFDQQSEMDLLVKNSVDCLVSKNSGGTSTQQKIVAARELGVPVYMLQRPMLESCNKEFNEIKACEAFVSHWFNNKD